MSFAWRLSSLRQWRRRSTRRLRGLRATAARALTCRPSTLCALCLRPRRHLLGEASTTWSLCLVRSAGRKGLPWRTSWCARTRATSALSDGRSGRPTLRAPSRCEMTFRDLTCYCSMTLLLPALRCVRPRGPCSHGERHRSRHARLPACGEAAALPNQLLGVKPGFSVGFRGLRATFLRRFTCGIGLLCKCVSAFGVSAGHAGASRELAGERQQAICSQVPPVCALWGTDCLPRQENNPHISTFARSFGTQSRVRGMRRSNCALTRHPPRPSPAPAAAIISRVPPRSVVAGACVRPSSWQTRSKGST